MTNLLNPKVSVLMPVYQTPETYLREAIESILTQTYTNFEFLILDDCPANPVENIVKSYHDKRIKYFKNKQNLGISPSRNKLIDLSKGEYLAVMDHDDISLPTRFEKEVAFLDSHPDVGVVGTWSKEIVKSKILKKPEADHKIKVALMRSCAILHPSSMIRKSVLIDNNIRYEAEFSPAEDYALWCRLIGITKFANIQEVLFHYRNHKNNSSHTKSSKMDDASLALWASVQAQYPALYNELLLSSSQTSTIRLFGFLPLFKIIKQNRRTKIYLFGKIPFLNIKTSLRY